LSIRLSLLLLLFSLFRFIFFVANIEFFPSANIVTFFYGIHFDLSAIFYMNAPYIVAILLPFVFTHKKIYQKICAVYFVIINSLAALVAYIDVAYYPYVLKRLTADIFSYLQTGFDFQALLPSFLKQFWYLLLIFILTVIGIGYILKISKKLTSSKITFDKFSWKEFSLNWFIFLLFIGMSTICMRGGLQFRPLTLIDAAKYGSSQNASLISNTPFCMIHSIGKQNKIEKHYFDDLQTAEQYFSPVHNAIFPCQNNCMPVKNVVIIILESFSKYMIYGMDSTTMGENSYSPFLNKLAHKSIAFNGIANGRRTIEALPSIFGGIPSLFDKGYVSSSFAANYTYSAIESLKKNGFNTLFFHGANNGSMNMENYCYSIGFEKYYGKNEYPNHKDDDGVWGISDRLYLKYVANMLNKARQPFFAGVLTLSSHNPFTLPKDGEGLSLREGAHPMHTVANYTDYAVKEFFEILSQYSWFDSTLFVIIGDHTGTATVPVNNNKYMLYQIPLFFYHPLSVSGEEKGFMQQVDIMPSILSYMGINIPLFSYGQNVFDTAWMPSAINYSSGVYQFFNNDYLLQFDGQKTVGFYNVKDDEMMEHDLTGQFPEKMANYQRQLEAIIQSYTTRMSRNKLFIGKDE